jgi:hypothetical protein
MSARKGHAVDRDYSNVADTFAEMQFVPPVAAWDFLLKEIGTVDFQREIVDSKAPVLLTIWCFLE